VLPLSALKLTASPAASPSESSDSSHSPQGTAPTPVGAKRQVRAEKNSYALAVHSCCRYLCYGLAT
jgi:hypothetical protein